MKLLYSFKHKVPSTGEIINLALRKPTRMELDETDMVYSQILSECMSRGILTRDMMVNVYRNAGGTLSKEQSKEYNNYVAKFLELSQLIDMEKGKKKKAVLEKERLEYFSLIQEIEGEQERLFDRSADYIARNKTILYLVFYLGLIDVDGDWHTLFPGAEISDKYESFSNREEENHEDAHALLEHLTFLVYFWYYGDKKFTESDFASYESLSKFYIADTEEPKPDGPDTSE